MEIIMDAVETAGIAVESRKAAASWLHSVSVLTMGIWLGAMIFFSFFFAPAAFKVIGSRHLTGTLITLLLTKLNIGTLILVPVWFLAFLSQSRAWQARSRAVTQIFLVLTGLAAAVSEFFFTPKMVALRAQMVSIDATPIDNPLRVEFNSLHHYSVLLLTIDMVAILVMILIATREKRS
jgi:hypothetical protein